jgi:hypothetical protein
MKKLNPLLPYLLLFGTIVLNGIVRGQNHIDFTFTGHIQRWQVPSCVTRIKIETWGAQGGNSTDCTDPKHMIPQEDGGLGGYATGELNVVSGQQLYIVVGSKGKIGANGSNEGGYNGGGDGGFFAGGGGGATDVRTAIHDLDSRLIVAGGGGGGNTGHPDAGTGGNGGGLLGQNGVALYVFTPGGGGGTQVVGGSAGFATGETGQWGQGGQAGIGEQQFHIAGGGGGWYGGGSAYAAGGGGGSSNIWGVLNGSSTAGVRAGDGLVRITMINDVSCVPCAVACVPDLKVSMPLDECYRVINPDEVLAHSNNQCSSFGYNLSITYPYGTDKLSGNDVDRSHLGHSLIYSVRDIGGNVCWGTLTVEDKSAPLVLCHGTQAVSCYQVSNLLDIKTQVFDNCSDLNKASVEKAMFTDFGCSDPHYLGRINRTIRASDNWGNTHTCSDTIYIRKDSIEAIQVPDLIRLACKITCKTPDVASTPTAGDYTDIFFSNDRANKYYPSPELLFALQKQDSFNTNKPCLGDYLNIVPYLYDSVLIWDEGEFIKQLQKINQYDTKSPYCKTEVRYKDELLPGCADGTGFKIRREWLINDWCSHQERAIIQYIEVLDNNGPKLNLPNGGADALDDRLYYRASVDPHSCYATVPLKALLVSDCSPTVEQSFIVSYIDPSDDAKTIVQHGALPGTIRLPANRGVYGVRCHDLTATLRDGCFNYTNALIQVCVIDDQPPEVIAKESMLSTLDPSTCWSRIYARDLDNGSADNCCNVLHFAIARMDSIHAARKYVYDAIIAQCGPSDYNNQKEYYDFYIEDYVSTYIFKDYIDLSTCGTYPIVLRVWEACGIPRFDPHVWPCSEHLWFMYNAGYPRSHYRADHNLNFGFSKHADYSKFKAPKDCDWRYPLIFCEPLLTNWFALAGLDDFNPYYVGAGAAELCNFSYYWPRLGNVKGSTLGSDQVPGNTCSRMLWKDAMVMVTLADKTPPIAEKPKDLFWYCDNVSTIEGNQYEFASCSDQSYVEDNASDGSCMDGKNSPYNEIECEIEHDGKLTDARDGAGKPFGWYGCNIYNLTHIDEHGVPVPCPTQKDSWSPVYCHSWLCLDVYDQAGKINPSNAFYKPELKNGSPAYSLADSNRFWIWDNCTIDKNSLIIHDTSIIDQCGNGWLQRRWTVNDYCGNVVSTEQKIITKHRSDVEAIFPADTRMACNQASDLSPAITGKPVITDDECELVGISYHDETFDIVPDACFKIVRTWKVIDWCKYDVNARHSHDIIVDDRMVADPVSRTCIYRNIKDNGDGFMTYVQIIKVYDTIAPVVTCGDTTICINAASCTDVAIDIPFKATDNCTRSSLLDYRWELDDNPSGIDLATKSYNVSGIDNKSATGMHSFSVNKGIGTSLVHVIARDRCGNEDTCTYILKVTDCKKPTPYCFNGITTVLMPHSGAITVWAKDLDAGSYDNCTAKNSLRFSFSQDINQVSTVFTCHDIVGGKITTVPLNIYVWDESNLFDYCKTYILLEDGSGNVCPDSLVFSRDQRQERIKIPNAIDRFGLWSYPPASDQGMQPHTYALFQNKPNPFSGSAMIDFYLPVSIDYRLSIADIAGRVAWVQNKYGLKGWNEVHITRAELKPVGIYYYTLETAGFKATKKMIIIN